MNRRIFVRNSALIGAGSLFFRNNALAAFFPQTGKIEMLRNNVGIYTERGGTIGFKIYDGGALVIDAQFPDSAKHFIDEIRKEKEQAFKFLLNTHHHGDHTSGNIAFKDIVANVVAHENSLKNQKTVAEKNNSTDKQLFPDITFTEELKLKDNKAKLKGYYFGAAHTNGDAVYHFEDANIAHVGDLMFNRRHPVVDRSAGASITHWAEVLDKVVKKFDKDTIYIFGHAGEGYKVYGSKEDLLAFRNYLAKLMDFARQEVQAGKTREEFIKNTGVPGAEEWKGNGERTFGAAYDEAAEGK